MEVGINSTVHLFADDTIAYLAVTSEAEQLKLQEDLNKLVIWEQKWKMVFHREMQRSHHQQKNQTDKT